LLVPFASKHEVQRDDPVGSKRERKRRENALDGALKNNFPASDPGSVEQPVLPVAHTIDASNQVPDFSRA